VRKLAKLSVFFSLNFVIIFIAAAGLRFLVLRVDWAQNLPQKPETALTLILTAAHWALSLAMYTAILIALSYAARRRYFAPMTFLCIMTLSLIFNFSISFALNSWKAVPPAQAEVKLMGEKGLILSNSLNRNETAVILLNGISEPMGPRVTVIPDRPLIFQESTANAHIQLPPVPFGNDVPYFIHSLSIDIRLSEQQLRERFEEGLPSYFIYAVSLVFMLSSLGFAIKFSVWPLANLFIGAVVFRGILAAETFFNSPEMQELFEIFLRGMLPVSMVVPVIFFGFGLMVNVYSILVYVARRRNEDD
jgi:hypothetical protein